MAGLLVRKAAERRLYVVPREEDSAVANIEKYAERGVKIHHAGHRDVLLRVHLKAARGISHAVTRRSQDCPTPDIPNPPPPH